MKGIGNFPKQIDKIGQFLTDRVIGNEETLSNEKSEHLTELYPYLQLGRP
jgi:hypothetical protein